MYWNVYLRFHCEMTPTRDSVDKESTADIDYLDE